MTPDSPSPPSSRRRTPWIWGSTWLSGRQNGTIPSYSPLFEQITASAMPPPQPPPRAAVPSLTLCLPAERGASGSTAARCHLPSLDGAGVRHWAACGRLTRALEFKRAIRHALLFALLQPPDASTALAQHVRWRQRCWHGRRRRSAAPLTACGVSVSSTGQVGGLPRMRDGGAVTAEGKRVRRRSGGSSRCSCRRR